MARPRRNFTEWSDDKYCELTNNLQIFDLMAFSERPGQAPVCSGDDYDEGQIVSIFFRKLQNLKKNSDRLARFPEQCRNTL